MNTYHITIVDIDYKISLMMVKTTHSSGVCILDSTFVWLFYPSQIIYDVYSMGLKVMQKEMTWYMEQ